MFKFLERVQADIKTVKDSDVKASDASGVEVKPGEIVLMTLKNQNLRRSFALLDRLVKELEDLEGEVLKGVLDSKSEPNDKVQHSVAGCKKCQNSLKLIEAQSYISSVKELLWAGVRAELTQAEIENLFQNGGNIGLRKGWKIVAFASQSRGIGITAIQIPLGGVLEQILKSR